MTGPLNQSLKAIAEHDRKTTEMVAGLNVVSLSNFKRRKDDRKELVKSFLKECKK